MQTQPIAATLFAWLLWVTIAAFFVTSGWETGQLARSPPPTTPPRIETPPPYFSASILTGPPLTTPPPPSTPPLTAGQLTIDFQSTYHYDPYRASFCFVVRLTPSELHYLPVFLSSLASCQYANLRLWMIGGELTSAMWNQAYGDIASIQVVFGRRFVYTQPGPFDSNSELLPSAHRALLQAERLAAELAASKYGHLLTEFDPECRNNSACYHPPFAELSAPLCDYVVHTSAAHFYNVQFAEALRTATDVQTDVIAFDFVSRSEEPAGECVARREGGFDSQVFAQWRPSCLRLAAIAFRGKYLLGSGKRFIEEEEVSGAGSRSAEYYGSLLALRMLREAEHALVHRVLVFEHPRYRTGATVHHSTDLR